MKSIFRKITSIFVLFILCLLLIVDDYEPSPKKAMVFNINGHYGAIDNAQAQAVEERLINELTNNGLANYKIYDSSELTEEILGNRIGETIIERCFSLITTEAGDGRILNCADPEFAYISYRNYTDDEIRVGTVMLSFMIYDPGNNYTDDIIERYDFVLTRDYEV